MADELRGEYDRETDIRYAAARGWVDAIIDPAETRDADRGVRRGDPSAASGGFSLGVFQV